MARLPLLAAVLAISISAVPSAGAQQSEQRVQPVLTTVEAVTVPVTRFRSNGETFLQYSGLNDSLTTVIRDAETWKSYWEAMHRRFVPAPPTPDVDFTREMIVLAAMGSSPNAGFDIHVAGATLWGNRLVVTISRASVSRGCPVSAVVTQPVDVVRMPATS